MNTKRLISFFVLFLGLLSAALGAGKPASDNFISDTVRQKLAADSVVKGGAIMVDVKTGVVTLSGKVQDPKQKSKAEKVAKKVNGVKSVVNSIQIEHP